MERLTHNADFGLPEYEQILYASPDDPEGAYNIIAVADFIYKDWARETLIKITEKLCKYEDTGLTPEQVSQLQIDYAAKGTLLAEYQNTGLTPPEIPSIVYHTDEDRFKTDCCGEDVTNTDYNFCPNCGKMLGEVVGNEN